MLFTVFVFIFGLIVGSFLNCLIYRLGIKRGFLFGRSFCPKCRHELSWKDLVPVFSFSFLKGKCRYCNKKISWQYPLVELGTAFLFVLVLHYFSPFINLFTFVYLIISVAFLVVIFVYDLKHFLILDKIIFPAIFIALIYNLLDLNHLFFSALPAAVGACLFFFFIFAISRGKWLGFGDVKLAFFLGLLLGFPNVLIGFFLSFLVGAIIGVGIIILQGKNLKTEVPFAPFLVIGTLIAGERILNWYLSFIF